jgi:uncharacterized protein YacL
MDKKEKESTTMTTLMFPPRMVAMLADEVAKVVMNRMPYMSSSKKSRKKKVKKVEDGIFLDTSAIIDGRIFDVIELGLLKDTVVVPEEILLELKHLADSQDTVKRERGREGLDSLEKLKKKKGVKVLTLSLDDVKSKSTKRKEVDEILIETAKYYQGRIITCDYNLEKKASIQGVASINMNALAQVLKVTAVPGEALHIKVLHPGKDNTQGVGYLDDGTMLVIEQGSQDIGKNIDVVVARVIQTSAGRILFAKKI